MTKNRTSQGGKPAHLSLGKKGEEAAAKFLAEKGYEILARNTRFGKKEIDVVARVEDTLVIVEVKSYQRPPLGAAEFRVDKAKRKNLIMAAQLFLGEHPEWAGFDVRFDVIIVDFSQWPARITHHQGAFIAEEYWGQPPYGI